MQKTFCDNCGDELVNYKAVIRVCVIHHASNGEYVGKNDFSPTDLCISCIDLVKAVIPHMFKASGRRDRYDPVGQDAPINL